MAWKENSKPKPEAPAKKNEDPRVTFDTWGTPNSSSTAYVWATLYDGVGSVKGHEESASRGARILFT